MENELSKFLNRTYNVFIYEDWKDPFNQTWIIKVKSDLLYKVIDENIVTFPSISYAYRVTDLSITYDPKRWMYSFLDEFPEILL